MAASLEIPTQLFINNQYTPAKSSERLTLYNPWDESVVTKDVHVAGPEDVDAAVAISRAAVKRGSVWSNFTGQQRAACMLKFADLIEKHADRLATIESLPTGRPFSMIRHFDLPHLASVYRYFAGWADKIAGKSYPADNGTYRIVQYEPLGVCAGIASWNATFLYVAWKIAPALAAGNSFIFKASEKSPLGALGIAPLYAEAGFPAGVVQFLTGARETGSLLASHTDINKISFTGSVLGGKAVQAAAVQSNLKRVTLELGGKSPAIIFDDAPMEVAVKSVADGFLFNSGQICVAASRVLVHESIAPKFIEAVKQRFEAANSNLGSNPLEPTTAHGPVVDKEQFARIMGYIDIGKQSSAELVTGGGRKGDKGFSIEPTLFVNPDKDNKIWTEEIFGPVLSLKTFKTEDEVIEMANDTTYGLASTLYTADLNRALRVSAALQTGGVSINSPFMPDVSMPFGGVKQSGNGRELGEEGLMAYLEPKSIYINMNIPPKL